MSCTELMHTWQWNSVLPAARWSVEFHLNETTMLPLEQGTDQVVRGPCYWQACVSAPLKHDVNAAVGVGSGPGGPNCATLLDSGEGIDFLSRASGTSTRGKTLASSTASSSFLILNLDAAPSHQRVGIATA